ncbi:zinc finger and SCAN domain-containing protein 22-like [Platysternon megacephalum]|uniref:Zinc finger and SCAN domain-containing protein 22-like n=1 Tax=Platysternon megacephalum TaxID=55544 RepID=A0A4D9E486_9SAUR|nr:zinc finger and SCAN domain-containing protein 22-like [Platysternon megacephalum]
MALSCGHITSMVFLQGEQEHAILLIFSVTSVLERQKGRLETGKRANGLQDKTTGKNILWILGIKIPFLEIECSKGDSLHHRHSYSRAKFIHPQPFSTDSIVLQKYLFHVN